MLKNLQAANFFLILSLGAMLIGFAPIFVKWSELSYSAILFWRMFLALPMLAILNYSLNKTFIFKVKNNSFIFQKFIKFFKSIRNYFVRYSKKN